MADRTSAGIFADIFERMAKRKITDELRAEAIEVWNDAWNYDFSHCQMDADEALVKLGLATECPECSYIIYRGDEADHSEAECAENQEN